MWVLPVSPSILGCSRCFRTRGARFSAPFSASPVGRRVLWSLPPPFFQTFLNLRAFSNRFPLLRRWPQKKVGWATWVAEVAPFLKKIFLGRKIGDRITRQALDSEKNYKFEELSFKGVKNIPQNFELTRIQFGEICFQTPICSQLAKFFLTWTLTWVPGFNIKQK